MGNKITSKNQKGGITAETVNVGSIDSVGVKKPPGRSLIAVIVAIAAVVSAVVAIWTM